MNSVFISYAHEDKAFLDRLLTHLKPLERAGKVDVWSDKKILSGMDWTKEIEKALANAGVAVLLISADFLASDFIDNDELPVILQAAADRGLVVLPVVVGVCDFYENKSIARFQAVNSPSSPVAKLTAAEQDEIWVNVAKRIKGLVSPP